MDSKGEDRIYFENLMEMFSKESLITDPYIPRAQAGVAKPGQRR
jgi:hypothetical protein